MYMLYHATNSRLAECRSFGELLGREGAPSNIIIIIMISISSSSMIIIIIIMISSSSRRRAPWRRFPACRRPEVGIK